jgi:hypothetical protein
MILDPSINWCVGGILLPWTLGPSTGATNLLNCIYTPTVQPHLPPIHSPLCSLSLLHPASVGWKATSRVLTAPSPPTSPMHKSSACHPCFSAPSGSKVTGSAPSPDSILLCIALSCSLLLHLQPSYSNFVGSTDENASSRSGVCGLVYPWSVACEPYCPQYWFTESVLCEQSRWGKWKCTNGCRQGCSGQGSETTRRLTMIPRRSTTICRILWRFTMIP